MEMNSFIQSSNEYGTDTMQSSNEYGTDTECLD
jgi:hypothetical protein